MCGVITRRGSVACRELGHSDAQRLEPLPGDFLDPCPPSTAPNRTSPAQGSVWSCPDLGAFVSGAKRREIRRGPNPAGLTQAGPGRGMTEDSDAATCGYYSPSHHAYAQIPGGRGQPAPFPFTPGSRRERVSFQGLLVPTPFGFPRQIQLELVGLPRLSTKIATPVGVVAGEPRSGLCRFYSAKKNLLHQVTFGPGSSSVLELREVVCKTKTLFQEGIFVLGRNPETKLGLDHRALQGSAGGKLRQGDARLGLGERRCQLLAAPLRQPRAPPAPPGLRVVPPLPL